MQDSEFKMKYLVKMFENGNPLLIGGFMKCENLNYIWRLETKQWCATKSFFTIIEQKLRNNPFFYFDLFHLIFYINKMTIERSHHSLTISNTDASSLHCQWNKQILRKVSIFHLNEGDIFAARQNGTWFAKRSRCQLKDVRKRKKGYFFSIIVDLIRLNIENR